MPLIDLHFHSTCSDGKLTVSKLADLIRKSGLEYCSLTDHDTVAGVPALQKHLKNHDIIVIPGVELTVLYKQQEIHILAYNFKVDQVNKILQAKRAITEQMKLKELEMAKILFQRNGFVVNKKLRKKKGQPIGLTIALDVYNNPQNSKKIKHRSPEQFYNTYQAPGAPCHTARSGVDVEWIIRNFKGVAGDMILGHPLSPVSYLVKPLEIADIKHLIKMGLDGIEIYHPDIGSKQVSSLENLAQKNGWDFTGGSDFHGDTKNTDVRLGYIRDKFAIQVFKLHGCAKKDR